MAYSGRAVRRIQVPSGNELIHTGNFSPKRLNLLRKLINSRRDFVATLLGIRYGGISHDVLLYVPFLYPECSSGARFSGHTELYRMRNSCIW